MRVCIVIPMHNEEAIAERSVRTVLPYLDALPYPTTLCIVNDGSRDRTPAILDALIAEFGDERITCIHHSVNQGYGAALRTGAQYAIDHGYAYVLFMDSDLTNHPRDLAPLYEQMRAGWSYIKASRYCRGSVVIGVPRAHRWVSWIGNVVARACFRLPIRDYTNGFRAVRADLLAQCTLTERGFAVIMEELCEAKRLGASCCEVPYTLTSRGADEGRSHLSYGFRTWRPYFRHAWNASRIPRAPSSPPTAC